MRAPYDYSNAIAVCRNALAQGPLYREKFSWRFHNRHFPLNVVRMLVEAGEAVIVGECCVKWRPQ